MAGKKNNTTTLIEKMLFLIIRFEIICLKLSLWLGVISALTDFTNICFQRYDIPATWQGLVGSSSGASNNFSVMSTLELRADGNYTPIVSTGGTRTTPNPANYGKWVRASLRVTNREQIRVEVSGQISLCRAYLPKYHLQVRNVGSSHTGSNYVTRSGSKIPIPRMDESGYLTMIMDPSNVKGWRNLTEVYRYDKLSVIVDDNISPGQSVTQSQTIATTTTCNSLTTAADRDACNAGLASLSTHSCTQSNASVRRLCQQRNARLATLTDAQCSSPTPDISDLCVIRASTRTATAQAQTVNVGSVSVRESVGNTTVTGNCSQNRTTYSPVCGRYSLWNGTSGRYVTGCSCARWISFCSDERYCCSWTSGLTGGAWCSRHCHRPHNCSYASYSTPPRPYLDDGSRTQARFTNTNMMQNVPNRGLCETSRSSCSSWTSAQIRNQFWFSASDVAGLQYKFNSSIHPGSSRAPGSSVTWASIMGTGTDIYPDADSPRKIYSQQHSDDTRYLQLRLHGVDFSGTSPTGGYVVKLKQTKCFREDASVATDSFTNRGQVQYLVLAPGDNPNTTPSLATSPSSLSSGQSDITASRDGYVWFKILNNSADYVDSKGTYRVALGKNQTYNSFVVTILNPIFNIMRTRIQNIGETIFQNTICYRAISTDPCTNFFNYVRAMLILYVTILGFRFMIGSQIKHDELVKSLLKVVIVGGLMNGSTYEFVAAYILPLVRGFSDEILANMSGFSMLSSTTSISNPFGFADALLTKIFMTPSFLFQVLTILGMHITGIFYFIVIVVALVLFITAIFQAMAVYVMALLATTLLVGMSPMFIVFMLFEKTYFMFQNWAKFLFKYMIEPVIVMAGIIVLTQLFTIYMDQVLSYSLCWKCALPFKIPFSSLLPFPGLQNVPIFCLYWFSPWGLSPYSDPMGIDVAMIIGLVIVAYTAYGWVNFSENIAINLVGGEGGPSSISLGQAFASNVAATQLKKYGLDNDSLRQARSRLSQNLKENRDAKAEHRAKGLGGGRGDDSGGSGGGDYSDPGGSPAPSTPKMGGGDVAPPSDAPKGGDSGAPKAAPAAPSTGGGGGGDKAQSTPTAPAKPATPPPADDGIPAPGDAQTSSAGGDAARATGETVSKAAGDAAQSAGDAAKKAADSIVDTDSVKADPADPDAVAAQQADRQLERDVTAAATGGAPTLPAGPGDQGGGLAGPDAGDADRGLGDAFADLASEAKDLGISAEGLDKLKGMSPEDIDKLQGLDKEALAQELGFDPESDRIDEIKDFMDRVKSFGSGAGR